MSSASNLTKASGGASEIHSAIPWQHRPAGSKSLLWRHTENPVIGRHYLPGAQGIYNSAVVPFGDGFAGVFRVELRTRFPHLHSGWSEDGLDWHIDPNPIAFGGDAEVAFSNDYAYDPRVCKIDDVYYISWCGGHNGPTISLATT
ncbi:MAG: hypothetical protein KDA61_02390, partial [Planctomycetales bacterium]|nr:hypothetical protein [Planctomycetales bacterium]